MHKMAQTNKNCNMVKYAKLNIYYISTFLCTSKGVLLHGIALRHVLTAILAQQCFYICCSCFLDIRIEKQLLQVTSCHSTTANMFHVHSHMEHQMTYTSSPLKNYLQYCPSRMLLLLPLAINFVENYIHLALSWPPLVIYCTNSTNLKIGCHLVTILLIAPLGCKLDSSFP